MSDHAQRNSTNTFYTPSKRLTPSEIKELRRKNTEELLEAAQLELEDLERLNENHEEAIKRGLKPEKLPWMIENMKKAVTRFSDKLGAMEKGDDDD